MLSFIKVYLKYYLIWIAFFIVARGIFLVYNHEYSQHLDFQEIINTFSFGIRLDLSTAGYFTILPFALLSLRDLLGTNKFVLPVLKVFTYILVAITALLITSDLEMYPNWGYRLDDLVLKVLKNPNETAASAGASPIGLLLTIFSILSFSTIYAFNKIVFKPLTDTPSVQLPFFTNRLVKCFSGIFLMASLVIPIRGGFQLAPINQSAVYFSQKTFANHAAINAIWNFMVSTYENTANTKNPYAYFEDEKAQAIIKDLFKKDTSGTRYLIKKNIKKPNVLIITWESLTAKAIERLGGAKGVTPNFDSLCKQGILFNNYYSSGHRTHFGLMGVLAAYPCVTEYNIFEIPRKAAQMSCMAKTIKPFGYETGFYYGGEAEFANFKNYLVTGQFNRLVTKEVFEKKDLNSKWGAYDHVLLERANKDLKEYKQPFFVNILTLSSHEPFEIPEGWPNMPGFIATKDVDENFKNAMYYTDRAVGQFIAEAQKQPWWENTLVVIIADHGSPHIAPHDNEFTNFHVPMLWLGGALAVKDTTLNILGSQTDIAATVFGQLDIKTDEYVWSKNIMSKNYKPFAYFNFHNGFGFLQEKGSYVWDTEGGYMRKKNGSVDSTDINIGKAYIQMTYQDYLSK